MTTQEIPNRSRQQGDGRLDAAVAAWRGREAARATGERLSDDARRAVLNAALEGAEGSGTPAPALRPLFVPLGRMLWLGGVPILALTVALGWLARPADTPRVAGADLSATASETATPVKAHVTKSGDEIVFLIANGQRPHAVYKSDAPDRFGTRPAFYTENGSFRDRLDSDTKLVFYRID